MVRGKLKVAEMFYRAVTYTVLLFGSDTSVLSEAMDRMVERNNTGFLRQINRNQVWIRSDGTWSTTASE